MPVLLWAYQNSRGWWAVRGWRKTVGQAGHPPGLWGHSPLQSPPLSTLPHDRLPFSKKEMPPSSTQVQQTWFISKPCKLMYVCLLFVISRIFTLSFPVFKSIKTLYNASCQKNSTTQNTESDICSSPHQSSSNSVLVFRQFFFFFKKK